MTARLIAWLFGCTHPNISWPQRSKLLPAVDYIVCLDCGHESFYLASEMRPLSDAEAQERQLAWTTEAAPDVTELERWATL